MSNHTNTPDIHTDTAGAWVGIAFLDGDDYDAAMQASGGTLEGLTAYLSEWDYGTETDDAHTAEGASWGSQDDTHTVMHGGLAYVLATAHRMGYVSLQRRPLAA